MSAAELRRYVREKLPEYMVPSAIVALDVLPLLPNGKLDRKALPAPERQRQVDESFVAPASALEAAIAAIWKELLGVDTVGVHDNFFDLGGHSLLVIQLQSRLRQVVDHDITVIDLFTYPTIRSLAARAVEAPQDGAVLLDAVRDRASKQREANRRRRLSTEPREVVR